jgi:hypothetical protein
MEISNTIAYPSYHGALDRIRLSAFNRYALSKIFLLCSPRSVLSRVHLFLAARGTTLLTSSLPLSSTVMKVMMALFCPSVQRSGARWKR